MTGEMAGSDGAFAGEPAEEAVRLIRLIQEQLAHSLLLDAELPHVIMATDQETGEMYLIGPFCDGLAAVLEADRKSHAAQRADTHVRYTVHCLEHPGFSAS